MQVGLVATQAFMNYADGVLTCSEDDSNPFSVRPSNAGRCRGPSDKPYPLLQSSAAPSVKPYRDWEGTPQCRMHEHARILQS